MLYLIFVASYANSQTRVPSGTRPFVLGVIDELQSVVLSEKRVLNIYLPEGYDRDDTTNYPVIYLLDGSADEDFIHISGLVQYNSFEWINLVPKSIVVGIATVDRRRDFTFPTTIASDKKAYPTTGHSDKFIAFLKSELQPFIGKRYRVNNSKTIIGQSLGGLLAAEIFLTDPAMFDKYIVVSPSIWWDNGSLLKVKPVLTEGSKSVYIGVGKEGLTPTAIPRIMEDDAKALAGKIDSLQNVKIFYDYLPGEDHATIMHQAVSNAFRLIYKNCPFRN